MRALSMCQCPILYQTFVTLCSAVWRARFREVYTPQPVVSPSQVEGIRRIDANDLDVTAAAAVRQNLELNDSKASGLVRPIQGDVRLAALQVNYHDNTFSIHWPDNPYNHFREGSTVDIVE